MIKRAALLLALLCMAGCDVFTGGYEYGSVRVTAVDRAGAPVSGVSLVLYTSDYILGKAVTGTDGTAVFTSVPAGDFVVLVRTPDAFLFLARPDTAYRPPVRDSVFSGLKVRQGEEATVGFTLRPSCCGTVRVRTSDARGAPVGRVRVVIYNTQGVASEGLTGADGSLVLSNVPEGEFAVRAEAPDSAFFVTSRDSVRYGFRMGERGDTTFTYRLRPACCAALRVSVRDNLGALVPGVEVLAYGVPNTGLGRFTTDNSGAFDLRLLAGTYGVRLERLPAGYAVPAGSTGLIDNIILLPDGSRSVTLDVRRQ